MNLWFCIFVLYNFLANIFLKNFLHVNIELTGEQVFPIPASIGDVT